MTPAFSSWHDFFAMGRYGFYIWLAVSCTLIPLIALLLHTLLQRRRQLADIRQHHAREQRIRLAKMKKVATAAGERP